VKEIVGIAIGAIILCLLAADRIAAIAAKYVEEEEDA
jgi:hypothetical protein